MKTKPTYAILCLLAVCITLTAQSQNVNRKDPLREAPPLLGVDVSHFQGDIDWQQIKADGLAFVYAKATQGNTYKDTFYHKSIKGADEAGIPIGGYHFYMAADEPAPQAENFLSYVGKISPGNMPPVLDLEQGSVKTAVDKDKLQKDILQWLSIVEEKMGIRPIIYTNNPFANEYLTDAKFSGYHLWIAHYTDADLPRVPHTWNDQRKGWLMWQRCERGTYRGIPDENVDHDIFNGSPEKLKSLLGK